MYVYIKKEYELYVLYDNATGNEVISHANVDWIFKYCERNGLYVTAFIK